MAALGIMDLIKCDPTLGRTLDSRLPITAAQVVWAARHEMARTVDDVLARRTRMLFLDARAALTAAPEAARLLAKELGRNEAWQAQQIRDFAGIARHYLVSTM
jgi:glycerol-3-phosphate dehydrogenase